MALVKAGINRETYWLNKFSKQPDYRERFEPLESQQRTFPRNCDCLHHTRVALRASSEWRPRCVARHGIRDGQYSIRRSATCLDCLWEYVEFAVQRRHSQGYVCRAGGRWTNLWTNEWASERATSRSVGRPAGLAWETIYLNSRRHVDTRFSLLLTFLMLIRPSYFTLIEWLIEWLPLTARLRSRIVATSRGACDISHSARQLLPVISAAPINFSLPFIFYFFFSLSYDVHMDLLISWSLLCL